MVKQISLDTWSQHRLTELLKKGSIISATANSPIVLYRETLEEQDESYEEIVCTLTDNYVVEQLIISGGGVIPSIKQQFIFTLDEFPERLLRKSKDLFKEVIDLLEEELKQ